MTDNPQALAKCRDCQFAEWDRTAAGKLHPRGHGLCTWTRTLALPSSLASWDAEAVARVLTDTRRHIWRNEPPPRCMTYQPRTKP
jgi:hypothetical protein